MRCRATRGRVNDARAGGRRGVSHLAAVHGRRPRRLRRWLARCRPGAPGAARPATSGRAATATVAAWMNHRSRCASSLADRRRSTPGTPLPRPDLLGRPGLGTDRRQRGTWRLRPCRRTSPAIRTTDPPPARAGHRCHGWRRAHHRQLPALDVSAVHADPTRLSVFVAVGGVTVRLGMAWRQLR